MMLVQAPAHAATLAREAVRLSGRTVAGFSGPWDQVGAARQALGLGEGTARKDSCEDLYTLELRHLAVPPPLAAGQVRCRHQRTRSSSSWPSGGSPSRSRRWARPPPLR